MNRADLVPSADRSGDSHDGWRKFAGKDER